MLQKAVVLFVALMSLSAASFAVDTRLIERGMDDLSYARTQIRRLIDENSGRPNRPTIDQLIAIEDLLAQAHQSIASGLYGDRPEEPGTGDYKYVCKSTSVPGAIGRGWTKAEAQAGAAGQCLKEKHYSYCDDASEFTCEAVPDVYPRRPLNYSKVCLSNAAPGALGRGWTVIEARAQAAEQCTKDKHYSYCDDASEFTCDAVAPEFLGRSNPPYRFACLSNNAPGAIGRALTKTEAIAEAATACKQTKHASYCDDDSEFTCEAVK